MIEYYEDLVVLETTQTMDYQIELDADHRNVGSIKFTLVRNTISLNVKDVEMYFCEDQCSLVVMSFLLNGSTIWKEK